MSRIMATLESQDTGYVVSRLVSVGFSLSNPDSGLITGFNEQGDQIVLETLQMAIEFLAQDHCLQLWQSSDQDLSVTRAIDGRISVHFDGYSESDTRALLKRLVTNGLPHSVELE